MKTKVIITIMLVLVSMSIALIAAEDAFTHRLKFSMEGEDPLGNLIEVVGEVRWRMTDEMVEKAIEEAIEEEEDEACVEVPWDWTEGEFEMKYWSGETKIDITSEFRAIEVYIDVGTEEVVSFDVSFPFTMWSWAAPEETFDYWIHVEVFLDERTSRVYGEVDAIGKIEFEEYGLNYFEVTTETEEDDVPIYETWVYPIKAEEIETVVDIDFFSTKGWTMEVEVEFEPVAS